MAGQAVPLLEPVERRAPHLVEFRLERAVELLLREPVQEIRRDLAQLPARVGPAPDFFQRLESMDAECRRDKVVHLRRGQLPVEPVRLRLALAAKLQPALVEPMQTYSDSFLRFVERIAPDHDGVAVAQAEPERRVRSGLDLQPDVALQLLRVHAADPIEIEAKLHACVGLDAARDLRHDPRAGRQIFGRGDLGR